MYRSWMRLVAIVSLALIATLNMGSGCLQINGGPDSPLLGTWQFKTDDGAIQDVHLTFDAASDLTSIRYAVGGYASITDRAPRGSASVVGSIVTVSTTFGLGNLTFNGVLDDAQTSVRGTTSFHFKLFVFSLDVNSGTATLTKE